MQKQHKRIIIIVVIAVVAVLSVGGGVILGNYFSDKKKPNFTKDFEIYVYPGTSVERIKDSLLTEGLVLRPKSLDRMFEEMNVYNAIKPGHYVVKSSYTSAYLSRMLIKNWQSPIKLTLAGTTRSKGSLAKKISRQMMVDSAAIMHALTDNDYLQKFDFDTVQVFSLFLPDTYEMYWTSDVDVIFTKFKKAYDDFWNDERRAKAVNIGLTPLEVSVLASIVNGETNYVPEMPAMASVYLTRLKKGMKLQACPTVNYCFGYSLHRILRKHTRYDSPYNTYKYRGLPPGPISVPPKSCIEAVLNPDNNNYLYFCATSNFDGTHKFASRYSEHRRNARDFQRALTKLQREKKAKENK